MKNWLCSIRMALCMSMGLVFGHDAAQAQPPSAELSIRVLDEQGVPVEGAHVDASFVISADRPEIRSLTDTNGIVHIGTTASDGGCYFAAWKEGYYPTREEYTFYKVDGGAWQPWNPVMTTELRRVVNPVPMHARNLETTIPGEDRPVGFDLEAGDWTAPHGRGIQDDFVFTYRRRAVSWDDFDVDLELTFSNPEDGIQELIWPFRSWLGSAFRLPREAPRSGYEPTWRKAFGATPQGYRGIGGREDVNFLFRVRSETNEVGIVTNAWHGKIHGDFELSGYGTDRTTLKFRYYLNPDGTRNMEFDPRQNLIQGAGGGAPLHLP